MRTLSESLQPWCLLLQPQSMRQQLRCALLRAGAYHPMQSITKCVHLPTVKTGGKGAMSLHVCFVLHMLLLLHGVVCYWLLHCMMKERHRPLGQDNFCWHGDVLRMFVVVKWMSNSTAIWRGCGIYAALLVLWLLQAVLTQLICVCAQDEVENTSQSQSTPAVAFRMLTKRAGRDDRSRAVQVIQSTL